MAAIGDGETAARKNPVGMVLAQLRCRPGALNFHPQPEAHSFLARVFADGLNVVRQPGAGVPVADIVIPAVRLRPIPSCVNEKRLGANVGSHIDFTVDSSLGLRSEEHTSEL